MNVATMQRSVEPMSQKEPEGASIPRMSILAICPTRERVDKCRRMLYSFDFASREGADIIFCLDYDDPQLGKYIELFEAEKRRYYIYFEKQTITQMFNDVALNHGRSYDIYHTSNDDFVYDTVDFDRLVIESVEANGSGIYYGNDKHWGADMAVAPFITADLVRAVGYLQMPRLIHLCNDTVWTEIGRTLGRLFYIPEIVIDHIHPETKGIERDVISQRVNSPEAYQQDYINYLLWYKFDREKDLDKCLEKLE